MSPFFDDLLCVPEGREQAFIQALIPEPAIEGFAEAVLGRLARPKKLQANDAPLRPIEHRQGGELRIVVTAVS